MKHQKPKTENRKRPRAQTPNTHHQRVLGVWNLGFLGSLKLGVWNFQLGFAL